MPFGVQASQRAGVGLEIKLDGYRAPALCDGNTTKLLSRNGNDLGLRFPAIVRSLAAAIPNGSIMDGELVALDSSGKRTGSWSKMRVELSQELVIGGCTPGTCGFDAILIGFYRDGELHFCASVRAGFVPASRRSLHVALNSLETAACPFVNLPDASAGRWGQGLTAAKMKNCVWLRPESVARFRFLEWTPSDHFRHASFVAIREDKAAQDVVKDGESRPARKQPRNASKKASQRRATA